MENAYYTKNTEEYKNIAWNEYPKYSFRKEMNISFLWWLPWLGANVPDTGLKRSTCMRTVCGAANRAEYDTVPEKNHIYGFDEFAGIYKRNKMQASKIWFMIRCWVGKVNLSIKNVMLKMGGNTFYNGVIMVYHWYYALLLRKSSCFYIEFVNLK